MKVFSNLISTLKVPSKYLKKYQILYYSIYDYVTNTYRESSVYKSQIAEWLNVALYLVVTDQYIPDNFCDEPQSYEGIGVPSEDVESALGELYLLPGDIYFDVKPVISISPDSEPDSYNTICEDTKEAVEEDNTEKTENDSNKPDKVKSPVSPKQEHTAPTFSYPVKSLEPPKTSEPNNLVRYTKKEDLFISFPKYPRVQGNCEGPLDISYPRVPTCQRDISCTTDVRNMSDKSLLNLFPNTFIRTRSIYMYRPVPGITFDPLYGLIVPVEGFTEDEVRDCIIRYPHAFRLRRRVDNTLTNFYSHIEIDGELLDTLKIWPFLPESKIISLNDMMSKQEQLEFVKEYVIRRYLLERDRGVQHKYDIYGSLKEFITLFMPAKSYVKEGYGDPVQLARTCVQNRQEYLRSRNPRLNSTDTMTINRCIFSPYCTSRICDRSCPDYNKLDHLLSVNNLPGFRGNGGFGDSVYRMSDEELRVYNAVYIECMRNSITTLQTDNTVTVSKKFTYVSICNMYKNNGTRTDVMSVRYTEYINSLQPTWGVPESQEDCIRENRIKLSRLLIISDLDYVTFRDFQSQKILQILQDRIRENLPTVIVSPNVDRLEGDGAKKMFSALRKYLKMHCIVMPNS